jgi:hypothetical protein
MRVAIADRVKPSVFVRQDAEIISTFATVEWISYGRWMPPQHLLNLWRVAGRSDVLYGFFAGEHMFAATVIFRLRRRRVIVSTGGYDSAHVPEHSYGLRTSWRRFVPFVITRLATRLLPISQGAHADLSRAFPAGTHKMEVLYLAVDPARWDDPHVERDAVSVVTVANIDATSFTRKGIDRFIAAAERDPHHEYVLIGQIDDEVRGMVPRLSNLHIFGPLPHGELKNALEFGLRATVLA